MDVTPPLSEVLRPKSLSEVIGQEHLVGTNGILTKLLSRKFLPSLVLWGPPGCGKTSIAELLATQIGAYFERHSAVTSTLSDIKKAIAEADTRLQENGGKTVLFIDEIHRFNKAQQDALLPHVEKGTVIFIGATTENPSFEVIAPLLSRCRVLTLQPLTSESLATLLDRGASHVSITLTPEARETVLLFSNGDGRMLLSILDVAAHLFGTKKPITKEQIEEASQQKTLQYDKGGEEHFNTISAFIKSMRASDVDASLYYLARMVAAGEDPLFIARRMVVFASEDVAAPTALVVANAVFQACQQIGYPECQENLAAGVVYLAQAAKDRSAYDAYMAALSDVKEFGNLPIPLSIRNAPTKLMKDLGYSKGYSMYGSESRLPKQLASKRYYDNKK